MICKSKLIKKKASKNMSQSGRSEWRGKMCRKSMGILTFIGDWR